MVSDTLKSGLERAKALINDVVAQNIDIDEKPAEISLRFRKNKGRNYRASLDVCIKAIDCAVWSLPGSIEGSLACDVRYSEKDKVVDMMSRAIELRKSYASRDYEKMLSIIDSMIALAGSLKLAEAGGMSFGIPKVPEEIRSEVTADLEEIKRAYEAGCYRSAVILCGRVLETVLHRKYYETTGIDILEKNPGIGLGKLIAKLSEKNVKLEPGLMQQVHLINQARVFSVHKKQEAFKPTKMQTQAMVLFLVDIISKLFS